MISPIKKGIYSVLKINKQNKLKYECVKICLIYFILGSTWIFFSDRIIFKLLENSNMLIVLETYKGWLYVIITTIILYLLINKLVNKVSLAEEKMNRSYEELSCVNEELEAYVQQLSASEEELRTQYDQLIENEKLLRESEGKYKTLITKMQQGLALYNGNPDDDIRNYKLVDANEAHELLTEINTKESIGKTIVELYPNLGHEYLQQLSPVIKTGQSTHYQHFFQDTDKFYEIIAYRPQELQLAVIVNDITQRKRAQDALKASEYTFRMLFENSSDAILISDEDKIIDCNLAMIKLLGESSKEGILGKPPYEFSIEKQPDGEYSKEKVLRMNEITLRDGKCKFDWWYKKWDGTVLPAEIMKTSIILNGKKVYHSLWRDINDRKQLEHKLEFLSYHDQLTGLYNRRFFEKELAQLDTENNLPLTLVMADVNGLKLVNDSFGHFAGDELLKKVAEIMKSGCPNNCTIARLAGDEFVIILPKTDTLSTERIIKNIKDLALKENVSSVEISISFGFETKKSIEENISDILKKAEDHMYKKKLFESPSMRGKTINTIITTLHEKNKREEQHSYRVSNLCESMGRAIGLSEDEVRELKTVGLLHDIGKIAIEENILNKPGKLTPEEWDEIKRHPEIGYRILSTANEMSEMAEYVLAHHEKWNGFGYPKQLKEEEIPLQSRIIAIADSYDAMISERSYRDALPEEVAIQELKTNAGIQFDARLVKIFIEKVLKKPW